MSLRNKKEWLEIEVINFLRFELSKVGTLKLTSDSVLLSVCTYQCVLITLISALISVYVSERKQFHFTSHMMI